MTDGFEVAASGILALVAEGQVRAAPGEDLSRHIMAQFQLMSPTKTQLERLMRLLHEMAARRVIDIEFAPGENGAAIGIGLAVKESTAKLRAEADHAHAECAELRARVAELTADLKAAEELLLTESQTHGTVSGTAITVALPMQKRRAGEASDVPKPARVQSDKRVALLQAQLAARDGRIIELHDRLKAVRAALVAAKRHFGRQQSPCGCVLTRTQIDECSFGGSGHAIYPIVAPGLPESMGARYLAGIMAKVGAELGVNASIIVDTKY